MYEAPKFVKVKLNVEEAFTTYECTYISDGNPFWLFEGEGCMDELHDGGTDISGTISQFAEQCWLSPSA